MCTVLCCMELNVSKDSGAVGGGGEGEGPSRGQTGTRSLSAAPGTH